MNTLSTARRARALVAMGAIALTAVALAGCETAAEPTTPDETTGGEELTGLAAEVDALTKPLDAYPMPTEAIDGASALEGKTVYYIPITQQSPQFAVTGAAITEALDALGAKVQICNGNATPTEVSACINQATQASAAAIVTDAVPYGLAANALDAAQAAGIPVIISNQIADDAHPESETLQFIETPGGDQQVAIAKWIALDSDGEANVLINQSTDGKSQIAYVAQAQEEFAKSCPDCTITINEVSSANFSLIPSSTSSALLKDPNVSYVVSQFAQYLQPTQTGAQQAASTAKGATGSSTIGALQQLASDNWLYAATAQAAAFQGWVDADAAARMILGVEVPEYTIPIRLFTRDSIADVDVSEEAEASGEWFGPTTFTDDFKKLWGVS
jgi:ribose transport system substrate-binding protein